MWLVVGLGNPGDEYVQSRHNVGFLVVESLRSKVKDFSGWKGDKYLQSEVSEGEIAGMEAVLVKPQTFMNKSGVAVAYAVKKHKLEPGQIIVVHDDVDLPLGGLKISQRRGSGGHRGVEGVRRALKSKDFVRVRVGVVPTTPTGKLKKPKGEQKVLDHLLGNFKKSEEKMRAIIVARAADAVCVIVTDGVQKAMNEFNSRNV